MTDWPATVAPKWVTARNYTVQWKRMSSERRRLCRLEIRRVGGRPLLTPQPRHGDKRKGHGCNTQQTHAADPRSLLPPFLDGDAPQL